MSCLFICSYFNWILYFEMCFNSDPGKFHLVTPDTRWAIVWGFVSYSINIDSYLISNINIKKVNFHVHLIPAFFLWCYYIVGSSDVNIFLLKYDLKSVCFTQLKETAHLMVSFALWYF